jgi:hypothetical protein
MRGPAALATYVAWGLILGGFAIIFGAWNGAAGIDSLAAQFPYLVSGGMVGVGFVIAGCALWIIQTTRQLGAQRAIEMKRLDLAMASVVKQLRSPKAAGPAGRDQGPEDVVVAGRSSFHEPGCHLIADRDDLDTVPRVAAAEQGLVPCRVCKPA